MTFINEDKVSEATSMIAEFKKKIKGLDFDIDGLTLEEKFLFSQYLFWEKIMKDQANIEQMLESKINSLLNNRLI